MFVLNSKITFESLEKINFKNAFFLKVLLFVFVLKFSIDFVCLSTFIFKLIKNSKFYYIALLLNKSMIALNE